MTDMTAEQAIGILSDAACAFDGDADDAYRCRDVALGGLAKLRERVKVLEAALNEYYLSEIAGFPSYEDGKDAQDEWADRRASARNKAAALTASLREGGDQ